MSDPTIEGATMFITLRAHLESLKDRENSKPKEHRRIVPTMEEIANDIGMSTVAMSNIATNKISQLSLKTGGKIIAAVRARGFPMEVGDLIGYREGETE